MKETCGHFKNATDQLFAGLLFRVSCFRWTADMHVNQTGGCSLTSERVGLPLKHWTVRSKLYVPSPFIWYRPQTLQKELLSNYRFHLPPMKEQFVVTNLQTTLQ